MEDRCDCEDYKELMPQIVSAQIFAYTHGTKYLGKVFKYCPWCGKEMKPVRRSDKHED